MGLKVCNIHPWMAWESARRGCPMCFREDQIKTLMTELDNLRAGKESCRDGHSVTWSKPDIPCPTCAMRKIGKSQAIKRNALIGELEADNEMLKAQLADMEDNRDALEAQNTQRIKDRAWDTTTAERQISELRRDRNELRSDSGKLYKRIDKAEAELKAARERIEELEAMGATPSWTACDVYSHGKIFFLYGECPLCEAFAAISKHYIREGNLMQELAKVRKAVGADHGGQP